MKNKIAFFLLLLIAPFQYSQNIQQSSPEEPSEVFEQPPVFSGGLTEMEKYLKEHTSYSKTDRKAKIQGACILKFVVEKNGSISNVSVIKPIEGCVDCSAEAVRVVSTMPKWTPAKVNGKPIRVYYRVPVRFVIKND